MELREAIPVAQGAVRVHGEPDCGAVLVRVSGWEGEGGVEAMLRVGGLDVRSGGQDGEEGDEWE